MLLRFDTKMGAFIRPLRLPVSRGSVPARLATPCNWVSRESYS